MAPGKTDDLSSFVEELSVNITDEDRERSRLRLQEHFQECESKLNGLVREHRGHLSTAVKLCGEVIRTVDESKTRCQAMKNRITRCMDMLQCNRDNIRRMWIESLEHKYAHKILSEIEELRKIPRKVDENLIDNKLEHATEVIVASLKVLNSKHYSAEALTDLRLELHNLQEKLYNLILEDLRKNLHLKDFFADNFGDDLKEVTYEDVFANKAPKTDHSLKESLNKINFDKVYVTLLLNCLRTMNRMPDAIEFLKENCQMEFATVCQEVSSLMNDVIEKSIDASPMDLPIEKQHIFLSDLVENSIDFLQKILDNYKEFFTLLQQVVETHAISGVEFTIEDVYSKLQVAFETFIGIYFEPHSFTSPRDSLAFDGSENMSAISTFFSPHSLPEDTDLTLFKFSNSCHGMNSKKKYSRETKALDIELNSEEEKEVAKPVVVCKPAVRNITLIYNRLKSFIKDIEQSLNLKSDDHCALYSFLQDSAHLFLDHVNSDISRMLKNVSVNLEAWNTTPVDECSNFRCGSEKEVLSCTLILNNILKELQSLKEYLPDYSNHFLRLIYYVILDYKDMYHRAFKQMFEEEQNILSVSWARDRDIRRLIKSFLNWRHLEDDETVVDFIESPEEISLRNKEESELLIRNLRSEDTSWEIIADSNKLSNLARLQENLVWFSDDLSKFIKKFNQSQPSQQISAEVEASSSESNVITSAVTGLRKVIKDYNDFADMCLLALHLEVRARCFHYLLTFSSCEIPVESSFLQELDTAVKRLTIDLLKIDEVLLPILTPKEFKYVFEGLGELVSSLMILIASNMNKINENTVRKLDRSIFIVQCCLANITMAREVSLERARHFIDLFLSTHEEILDSLVEEGPRFNEQEYATVFRIISSSAEETRRELGYYLEKLKLIFERLCDSAKEVA